MHQMARLRHPTGEKVVFRGTRRAMAPVKINISWRKSFGNTLTTLAMALALVSPALQAQSSGSQTQPPGSTPRMPRNQIDGLLTFKITTNFVQIPVMVKTPDGRRVDGLLPKDFTVL